MKHPFLFFVVGILAFSAVLLQQCVQPPEYPIEPVITFKGLSKNNLRQKNLSADSLAITFSFTDGDGDLGFEDNEGSVFLVDTRDGFEKLPYSIPFVGLQGVGNGISGEITVVLANSQTCCIYDILPPCTVAAGQDTLSFKIRIKDRAGHFSNEIETAPIYLRCQ